MGLVWCKMKVSASKPFQLVYSLFEHEYLGYLFESFVIALNEKGSLTYQHQNISFKNAEEFSHGLDKIDYKLIELMDSIQQDAIARKFSRKPIKTDDFFIKTYDQEKGNKELQEQISVFLEKRRSQILELISEKQVYEMGKDGEPAWKKLEVQAEKASVLFHFRRNEENTHYFPTIKFGGEKIDFQYKGAYIICHHPAWMVLEGKLFTFEKAVDGKKILPFLNKKFIVVPKKLEETYYKKFIAPLIETFDVYAKGFEIKTYHSDPKPQLRLTTLRKTLTVSNLFEETAIEDKDFENDDIIIELSFIYNRFIFKADKVGEVNVKLEKAGEEYTFYRVNRNIEQEKNILRQLISSGLQFRHAKSVLPKSNAFEWIKNNHSLLRALDIEIIQESADNKTYFIGEPVIQIKINENIDWFDIEAVIQFGEFTIPFNQLRKYILSKKTEFTLPNGQIAVIPESWITEYNELFAFSEVNEETEGIQLKKYHIALVEELEAENLAHLTISKKLEKLRDFTKIEDITPPEGFNGLLRPYQQAGFNWLNFLNHFKFGGCLADDMGLGKTVQALSLIQHLKENNQQGTSLLVLPTSLVYNWENEARKFTPDLKVFTYTGSNRDKNPEKLNEYDLVLTTYGIIRLDYDILSGFFFNYIILDESQAIKNPSSHISKAVRFLNGRNRLILTGTPLENSTMDLWSQIDFINPGLLGSKGFFKKEFLKPIEKQGDLKKIKRLSGMIKPFIMRRHKSQVATELPEKVENVYYCSMTPEQEELYEETKSAYRNQIISQTDNKWLKTNQLLVLQGLTKLRQIANHPFMIDDTYEGTSGKMEDVVSMIDSTIGEHKILIFSQFVKHLKIFQRHLDQQHISYAYLDGSTKDRQKEVETFQQREDIKIFLISLKAGGVGLNLTKADYVFILDPWWNPAAEAQAIDRTHRIGQENKVFAYKFITKNSVEEKILMLQQRKLKLSNDLITTEESFVKSLTTEDIISILT